MIVTFYSYKGGVGRSMALANIAEILAETYDVIVCDWDLEAPGLGAYFASTEEQKRQWQSWPGTMDLLHEYQEQVSKPPNDIGPPAEPPNGALPFAVVGSLYLRRPLSYAHAIDTERPRKGSIRILTAGRMDKQHYHRYVESVQDFRWSEFYDKWAGGSYLEFYREDLDGAGDIVLIDSRTGITEHGGVCTHHLADVVVLLSACNESSVQGTLEIASDLAAMDLKQRCDRPISLLPVAARVDRTAETVSLTEFQELFERKLVPYVAREVGDPRAFVTDCQIPYVPFYSFADRIAAREPENRRHPDLFRAYEKLARAIITVGIARADLKARDFAEAARFAEEKLKQLEEVTEMLATQSLGPKQSRVTVKWEILEQRGKQAQDRVDEFWSSLRERRPL